MFSIPLVIIIPLAILSSATGKFIAYFHLSRCCFSFCTLISSNIE